MIIYIIFDSFTVITRVDIAKYLFLTKPLLVYVYINQFIIIIRIIITKSQSKMFLLINNKHNLKSKLDYNCSPNNILN